MRVLSRTWQMLLKGIAEVQAAGRPVAAAEMVLVRIAYAADLPTPDEVVRSLQREAARRRPVRRATAAPVRAACRGYAPRYEAPRGSPRSSPRRYRRGAGRAIRSRRPTSRSAAPTLLPSIRFEELIALAAEKRDIAVKMALERDVRLVRCEDGQLEIALEPSAPKTLVHDLQRKLRLDRQALDRGRCRRSRARRPCARRRMRSRREIERGVQSDPLVQAVLDAFSRRRRSSSARDADMRRMPTSRDADRRD